MLEGSGVQAGSYSVQLMAWYDPSDLLRFVLSWFPYSCTMMRLYGDGTVWEGTWGSESSQLEVWIRLSYSAAKLLYAGSDASWEREIATQ